MTRFRIILAVFAIAVGGCSADAKTIVLNGWDWDQAASIAENAPSMSWVNITGFYVNPKQSLLIRYQFNQIPPGMRITNAEWVLPIHQGLDVRFYVWRILQDWGPGVCHEYRMIRPEKLAWAEPGGRGLGTDRLVQPSAACRPQATDISQYGPDGGLVVNVTKDVTLWYTGAAANFGWMITAEDTIYFHSPFGRGSEVWKLRITYEPE